MRRWTRDAAAWNKALLHCSPLRAFPVGLSTEGKRPTGGAWLWAMTRCTGAYREATRCASSVGGGTAREPTSALGANTIQPMDGAKASRRPECGRADTRPPSPIDCGGGDTATDERGANERPNDGSLAPMDWNCLWTETVFPVCVACVDAKAAFVAEVMAIVLEAAKASNVPPAEDLLRAIKAKFECQSSFFPFSIQLLMVERLCEDLVLLMAASIVQKADLEFVLHGFEAPGDGKQAGQPRDGQRPRWVEDGVARRLLGLCGCWGAKKFLTRAGFMCLLRALESAANKDAPNPIIVPNIMEQLENQFILAIGDFNVNSIRHTSLRDFVHCGSVTKLCYVAREETRKYVEERTVKWFAESTTVHDGLTAEMHRLMMSFISWPIVAIHGESGSGKTITAIRSSLMLPKIAACVYLRGEELMNANQAAVEFFETSDRTSTAPDEGRCELVESRFLDALRGACGPMQITVTVDEPAVIVLDDMGMMPALVRWICRYRSIDGVRRCLGVPKVLFVLVGTGLDGAFNLISSDPDSFIRFPMTSNHVVKAMRSLPVAKALEGTDSNSPMMLLMSRLEENARLMACIVRSLTLVPSFADALERPEVRASRHHRDLILAATIPRAFGEFRALNGLAKLHHLHIMAIYGVAFALTTANFHQTAPPEVHALLLDKCGIITDNACTVDELIETLKRTLRAGADAPRENEVDLQPLVQELQAGKDAAVTAETRHHFLVKDPAARSLLSIPKEKRHRFAMTAATVEMGVRGLGFASQYVGWSGFEAVVADTVYLHAWGAASAVSFLGPTVLQPVPVEGDPLSEIKNWTRRAVVELGVCRVLQVTLHDAVTTLKTMQIELERRVVEECKRKDGMRPSKDEWVLIVATNRDRAAFADVMVAAVQVPAKGGCAAKMKRCMLLQCKHYKTGRLAQHEAFGELHKMGMITTESVLGRIVTKLPPKASMEAVREELLTHFSNCGSGLPVRRLTKPKLFAKLCASNLVLSEPCPACDGVEFEFRIILYCGDNAVENLDAPLVRHLCAINKTSAKFAFHPTGWHGDVVSDAYETLSSKRHLVMDRATYDGVFTVLAGQRA